LPNPTEGLLVPEEHAPAYRAYWSQHGYHHAHSNNPGYDPGYPQLAYTVSQWPYLTAVHQACLRAELSEGERRGYTPPPTYLRGNVPSNTIFRRILAEYTRYARNRLKANEMGQQILEAFEGQPLPQEIAHWQQPHPLFSVEHIGRVCLHAAGLIPTAQALEDAFPPGTLVYESGARPRATEWHAWACQEIRTWAKSNKVYENPLRDKRARSKDELGRSREVSEDGTPLLPTGLVAESRLDYIAVGRELGDVWNWIRSLYTPEQWEEMLQARSWDGLLEDRKALEYASWMHSKVVHQKEQERFKQQQAEQARQAAEQEEQRRLQLEQEARDAAEKAWAEILPRALEDLERGDIPDLGPLGKVISTEPRPEPGATYVPDPYKRVYPEPVPRPTPEPDESLEDLAQAAELARGEPQEPQPTPTAQPEPTPEPHERTLKIKVPKTGPNPFLASDLDIFSDEFDVKAERERDKKAEEERRAAEELERRRVKRELRLPAWAPADWEDYKSADFIPLPYEFIWTFFADVTSPLEELQDHLNRLWLVRVKYPAVKSMLENNAALLHWQGLELPEWLEEFVNKPGQAVYLDEALKHGLEVGPLARGAPNLDL
jgi:hypothetical protein